MAAAAASDAPGRHEFISPDEGMSILAALLPAAPPRMAVLPIVWSEWRDRHPVFARAPFLRRVIDQQAAAGETIGRDRGRPASMKKALLAAAVPERQTMLAGLALEVVAGVVRLPASSLDPEAPLRNLGMDSLMALEIRNHFQDRAGVTLPLVTIVEGPSIAQLVTVLLTALDELARATVTSPTGISDGAGAGSSLPAAADLDELSDENVDAMLRRMLAEQ
jgi:acyl carrier protein